MPESATTSNPATTTTKFTPKGDEYDRFEDLAKKLVKVPKSEIDAERKAAEKAGR